MQVEVLRFKMGINNIPILNLYLYLENFLFIISITPFFDSVNHRKRQTILCAPHYPTVFRTM